MKTEPSPRRGEVWRVEFEPARGAEIRKTRPALVVSRDDVGRLPLRLIVPLTAWQDAFERWPWMVKIQADAFNGLTKDSAADTFQARSFSVERFIDRLGKVASPEIQNVALALAAVVGVEIESRDES